MTELKKNATVSEDFNTMRSEASFPESEQRLPPKELNITTALFYDQSLLEAFGSDQNRVENHLLSIAELVKPLMTLLEIKVKLRVIGVFRISDRIDTSKYWYKKIQKKLSSKLCKTKIRNPNLFSFFTAKKGRVSFVIPAKHNIITPVSYHTRIRWCCGKSIEGNCVQWNDGYLYLKQRERKK